MYIPVRSHLMFFIFNAVGPLQFTNIGNNKLCLLPADMPLRQHIAKPPVMLGHTALHCPVKSHIRMMARIIDVMQQGRALFGAQRIDPMTLGAVFIEKLQTFLRRSRKRRDNNLLSGRYPLCFVFIPYGINSRQRPQQNHHTYKLTHSTLSLNTVSVFQYSRSLKYCGLVLRSESQNML